MNKEISPTFPALIQEFFTDYMVNQRALSPRTVACYRDSFSILLSFAEQRLGKPPTALKLADIDPKFLANFLDHLERDRHNSVRSRNIRLAAIRSFLKFASRRDITSLRVIEQALAVPMKRFERPMIGFLTREQMLAILDIPVTTWLEQRDRLLLTMMYNTGARVSEIIGVRVADVTLSDTTSVHLRGKGRKQRAVPLWRSTAKEVREWLKVNDQFTPESPLLPTRDRQAKDSLHYLGRRFISSTRSATQRWRGTCARMAPHKFPGSKRLQERKPLMVTSNSPTFGQSNSPRQDG